MPNSQTTADYELKTLQISEITIGRDNPRVIFPESADIKELADSIAASGVIEPVHVRRTGNGLHELIAGERRLMAAKIADRKTVPVIDHGAIGDDEAFEITFLENFGRKDLTVMEESLAVKMCIKKFGSSEKVAERLGKSVRWVEQRANIEKGLSDEWKKKIATELPFTAWPASHIALIARFPRHVQDECVNDFWDIDDNVITLSELHAKLRGRVKMLDKAPWDLDAKGPDKKTTACKKCPKRSSVQPGLWDDPVADAAKNDRCLDPGCWQKKFDGWLKGRLKELRDQYGKVICLAAKYVYYPELGTLRDAFGDISQPDGLSVVKKQADDRTAALIVYGAGLGEVRWVKDKVAASTKGKPGKVCDLLGHGSKPKTLKKSREELNSKRWFEVLREMQAAVRKSTADDITVAAAERTLFIMNIAAMWGAKGGVCFYGPVAKNMQKSFEKYLVMESLDKAQAAVDAALWEKVKPEVVQCVTYGDAITRVPKDKIDNARVIAGYLGIDIKAMFEKQKTEIAEPASWKGLKADGTPKKAAKTAAKKKATTGKKAAQKKS